MGLGFQEFVLFAAVVALLSMAGLWPQIIRALRELRGEHVDDPPAPAARDLDVCYKMLGISPSAPWDAVEKAYRAKAKIHHPDRGGDQDTMRALNEAYSKIKKSRGVGR
ncbi:MAG: DnaJ domain-containing protein [Candidatus Hydrogenedentes bacterium]|nr:DnaJ domain-containing protein [Candidatus Hydrogenedentota bacterium]